MAAFDRVVMKADGGSKTLTRDQFEELPIDKRVRAILAKEVRFYSGDKEVPPREALGRT